MPQLTCEDLALGYEGKIILSGLSFSVNAGDYLCIVGENGSGKTTLIKTILALKAPASGRITLGDGLKREDMGYLPQQTQIQKDFPATVEEVALSGCLNRRGFRPFYSKAEKQRAEANMEKLGISPLAKHCYRDLSGGQQQRALLARALCAAGKILLLDEPAAGLDPKASNDMYALVKRLNTEGTTIIMISHDLAAAVKDSSHILHVGKQRALFSGAKPDYPASEAGRMYAGAGGYPA